MEIKNLGQLEKGLMGQMNHKIEVITNLTELANKEGYGKIEKSKYKEIYLKCSMSS